MADRKEEHDHSLSTKRIEAFSDGVIAIAMTLLVLDLKVPATPDLSEIGPQFTSFVLSFFVVCIFWVNHHQFFHILDKATRKLLWLNNLLLFWICFIPFPTAFLGRYPTHVLAVMLYGAVLCAAAVSFSLMTHYAMFKGNLMERHVGMEERKSAQQRSYWGIILYGLSVVLAPVSVTISLAIFCIVPLIYFVPRRVQYSPEAD
jgi:uncharacterized membrane protein